MTINEFIQRHILPRPAPPSAPPRDTLQGERGGDLPEQDSKRQKLASETLSHSLPPVAYLAQHALFSQIPALGRDFLPPDYTCLLLPDEDPDDNELIVNAWFGPIGTVSPLHHDPYHNLLAQVHGVSAPVSLTPSTPLMWAFPSCCFVM
jgi:hypothetical protein